MEINRGIGPLDFAISKQISRRGEEVAESVSYMDSHFSGRKQQSIEFKSNQLSPRGEI